MSSSGSAPRSTRSSASSRDSSTSTAAAVSPAERDAQLTGDDRALLTARLEAGSPVTVGEPVELAVRRDRMHFFAREDGARIEPAAALSAAS